MGHESKTISVTNANKLGAMFTRFDSNKNALEKLYGGRHTIYFYNGND